MALQVAAVPECYATPKGGNVGVAPIGDDVPSRQREQPERHERYHGRIVARRSSPERE